MSVMLDPRVHPDVRAWLAGSSRAMWSDGRPFPGSAPERLAVHDPATATTVATVPDATPADVDRVVSAASAALAGGAWQALVPAARERILLRLADLVESHADALQHLIVLENGRYEVTGGQRTAAAGTLADFAAMARAAGFDSVAAFDSLDEWRRRAIETLALPGPRFIVLAVEPVNDTRQPNDLRPGAHDGHDLELRRGVHFGSIRVA